MSCFLRPNLILPVFTPGSWLILFNTALAAAAVVFLLHLQEYRAWNYPELRVDSEFIMGTHDAYHWLAGAKGFGRAAGTPMALILKWLATVTGLSVGLIGFWAPVVASSLLASGVVLWTWTLGTAEAGLVAGVLAGLAPGFFYRTRFGYYDTDIISLLFPVLIGLVVVFWLTPRLARNLRGLRWRPREWLGNRQTCSAPAAPIAVQELALLMGLGLFARWCGTWHLDIIEFSRALACLAAVMIFFLGRDKIRWGMFWGLASFGLTAFSGRIGLGLAVVLLVALALWPSWRVRVTSSPWLALAVMIFVLLLGGVVDVLFIRVVSFVNGYLKPVTQHMVNGMAGVGVKVVYPDIAQSVMEAQNIDFGLLLMRIHPWSWVTLLGLAGYGWLCYVRPSALLLLIFLLPWLSSIKLGMRMAMFGAPPILIGLAVPLSWFCRWLAGHLMSDKGANRLVLYSGQIVFLGLFVLPYLQCYPYEQATPVLCQAHCRALQELGKISPSDALVWTWWDWGYATHYYAQRASFADGGKHSGEYIYTLGRVFTTPSPRQANQLMRFVAIQNEQPWQIWNRQSADQVQEFTDSLAHQDLNLPSPVKQYLIITMENLRICSWITFYGTWNMLSRNGQHAMVSVIKDQFDVDYQLGIALFKDQPVNFTISTIDILGSKGIESHRFLNPRGQHLVFVPDEEDCLVLDNLAYESLMVQLLIARPDDPRFVPFFRLVYQDLPWVRIYELQ
ncbi:undecaprenyl-diphosphooligosaccharide---protein glycotransferase [Desulfovibrionales bacterium]